MSSNDIEMISVTKAYGSHRAVNEVNLAIPAGEFVSILGPSGCGKTTTLNMIAGFAHPSSGDIRIRGKSQNGVPPEKRGIGMVFQNYALFPHMTVEENVAFGLKMKKRPIGEIRDAVKHALRRVHLDGYGERYPKELSGGQQQRAALARAIAPEPSLLLLDEPLSNLDLKLREAMRVELKDIQEQLAMTFVYVTHDQDEAMAMSDRIVVMQNGVVAQCGRPADIYDHPRSSFVADFIGKSNLLPIQEVQRSGKDWVVSVATGLSLRAKTPDDTLADPPQYCCIRPEAVRLTMVESDASTSANRLAGTLTRMVNLGAYFDCFVTLQDGTVLKSLVRSTRLPGLTSNQTVFLSIEREAVQLLPR
ncbi:spermidine/putrescine ABC transporter ATP-binding subunit [Pseudorhizobium tarimense]|uniref:Spermidine/putrescine ABC transporter ATP-binding subunit n=1 Tax=Pseudorhizobium tarimense TaxID=1079109 RepID=A0ABV2HC52_9HYPH|nr:ABC transporter ATP-binding protein [Pseudorhizobium tarimense]MCJ8521148.1 ABC transporter ATP-binding protein [Pseudorhizobium tarimense]